MEDMEDCLCMNVEDYRKAYKDILFGGYSRETAYKKFVNLLIIYAQDGALAGEKYYGNNMAIKGKIICGIGHYFFAEKILHEK